MIRFTVMTYNINEGVNLNAAADTIRARNADVVLLNEITWRPSLPWNKHASNDQTNYLAYAVGYAHKVYRHVTFLGFAGTKGVSILSRYPILEPLVHFVPGTTHIGGFGTLEATLDVPGRAHRVFSTRFPPMHDPDHPEYDPAAEFKNKAAHEQAADLVATVPPTVPVIYGGDLNAAWSHTAPTPGRQPSGEWARNFRDTSGLKEVLLTSFGPTPSPEQTAATEGRVDYIYYRGPYRVESAELAMGFPGASDHAFLVATLAEEVAVPTTPPPPDPCEELRRQIQGELDDLAELQDELSGGSGSGRAKYAIVRSIRQKKQRAELLRSEARARGCANVP